MLRGEDPVFAQAWDDAEIVAADMLELEARRRAVEGTERYVLSHGEVVIYEGKPLKIKEYSDTLLLYLLKAHKPGLFCDRSKVELSGKVETNGITEDDLKTQTHEINRSKSTGTGPCQQRRR